MSRFCHYLVRDINNCYRDGKKTVYSTKYIRQKKHIRAKTRTNQVKTYQRQKISETKQNRNKTYQRQPILETKHIRDKTYKRQNTSETKHIMGNIH